MRNSLIYRALVLNLAHATTPASAAMVLPFVLPGRLQNLRKRFFYWRAVYWYRFELQNDLLQRKPLVRVIDCSMAAELRPCKYERLLQLSTNCRVHNIHMLSCWFMWRFHFTGSLSQHTPTYFSSCVLQHQWGRFILAGAVVRALQKGARGRTFVALIIRATFYVFTCSDREEEIADYNARKDNVAAHSDAMWDEELALHTPDVLAAGASPRLCMCGANCCLYGS